MEAVPLWGREISFACPDGEGETPRLQGTGHCGVFSSFKRQIWTIPGMPRVLERGAPMMRSLRFLLIRLILSLVLAFLISRFFFPGISIIKMLGLAAVMLAMAYLFEHTRKRDKGVEDES